ncbi:MAG: 2,3-bisphosphoglycerate-independent phosphoglycerate mutase [Chloroflexi bacterium]|nr:2,3-bisphosphoglycerate-independent phosphoglycerate mutase [Chloroflexota bacterium]
MQKLSINTPTKIVLLIFDGIGGLPDQSTGKTELETANKPNLNNIAKKSVCGMTIPIDHGITPGSGPSHLALFGYDPVKYNIGRGVLEALGINFDLQKNDVASRANFCTVDQNNIIIDRRAGRIATERNAELCKKLSTIKLPGIKLFILPVREHRFVIVFRGEGLGSGLEDSDPQHEGFKALPVKAMDLESEKMGKLANQFIDEARKILVDSHPANMILLRGFSKLPDIPTMKQIYKLNPVAIAAYPMYLGLAKLVGMKVISCANVDEEFNVLEQVYKDHDFFYIHIKHTDSRGEDGDFAEKVKVIEKVDSLIPALMKLNPDVIVVTGDHSTPALLKSHSWHTVPLIIYSKWCRYDGITEFNERTCRTGSLNNLYAVSVMSLAMGNALKLEKYGA